MIIARAVLDDLVGHASECRPLECCGLLIGDRDRIVDSLRAKNVAASPTRYLIDPADHIRARRAARLRGLDVVGFYHSHPKGPAVPSPRDILEATYQHAIWIVVSLAEGASVRAFTIDKGRADEVPLIPEGEDG